MAIVIDGRFLTPEQMYALERDGQPPVSTPPPAVERGTQLTLVDPASVAGRRPSIVELYEERMR
jgi:hypothetical protein